MKQTKGNRRLVKFVCVLLAICMAAGMTACTKEEQGGSNSSNNAAKNAVFREEEIALNLEHQISYLNQLVKVGDRLYTYTDSYEDDISTTWLVSFGMDGSDIRYTALRTVDYSAYYDDIPIDLIEPYEEEIGIDDTADSGETAETAEEAEPDEDVLAGDTADTDGSEIIAETGAVAVDSIYTGGEEYSYTSSYFTSLAADQNYLYLIEDCYSSGSNGYWETYSLLCFDLDGNQLWSVPLGENGSDALSYFYATRMYGLEDGVLMQTSQDNESMLVTYDSQGNMVRSNPLEVGYLDNLLYTPDGQLLIQYMTETDYTEWLATYDPATGAVGEPFQIPDVSQWSYSLSNNVFGGTYDLYYTSSQSLYGYNIGAEASVEIMNYIDSDIDSSYIQNMLILDDENLLVTRYDYSANNGMGAFYLSTLTKVAPEDVVDKIILQLACYGSMYNIRSKVIDFNKSSDTYRIRITDYSTYNSQDDYTAGITRLNSDIISGNTPDIIYLNSFMPVSSFISKGVLADLYPFIDQDPDLSREDLLSNVLEAFSVDGKLYQLVPSFDIMTLVAKSKLVGDEPGWTVQEMIDFAKNADPEAQLFESTVASDFLSMIINYSGNEWINWDEGTCNFNSESFIDLLEFSNTLPKDYSVYEELWNSDDYWANYESMYREERTLLNPLYIDSFRGAQSTKYGTFGEDITLIGYPMTEGNGAILTYNTAIAISSSCKNPEGAWSYVRQFLMEDYQSTITYDWPITVKQLEVLKEQAKEKPYYLDADGNKIEYEQTYWIGGQEIVIPVPTDEEIAQICDVITSTTTTYHYDESLMNIISEEVEAFYSGQKTAANVADIIQSRASIYISENQ